jgi:hypothetical protein
VIKITFQSVFLIKTTTNINKKNINLKLFKNIKKFRKVKSNRTSKQPVKILMKKEKTFINKLFYFNEILIITLLVK